jgi:hypothetical protein
MSDSFNIRTTSASSAKIQDIWIDPPEDSALAMTRKIVRAELVDNVHSDQARVKVTVIHQKRHKKSEPWQNCDNFSLATLKAGQEVKLYLNAAETLHLHRILTELHTITAAGIPKSDGTLTVVDESKAVIVKGRAADLVRQMNDEASDEFWEAIKELQPNLFRAVALTKLHELRENAVSEFRRHMAANDWAEGDWQKFFEQNTWIFGYGLSYRFLATLTAQPNYGGTTVTGGGAQRGDYFVASEAERRFTVLVEIKRPDSLLVHPKLYRSSVHHLGPDLTGGVSQLQANCRTWETEGSRTSGNREQLERQACYTIQPKGILIIGHTRQLDNEAKRATFELFRRSLHNPEVITFDELLGRAEHLLLNAAKEMNVGAGPDEITFEPLADAGSSSA